LTRISSRPSTVDVTVVIPFRNAAPHIRGQLEALACQDFEGTWEVVLVDNGSED
jgi:glycosyltransferase involved in cell wall biosynthesis